MTSSTLQQISHDVHAHIAPHDVDGYFGNKRNCSKIYFYLFLYVSLEKFAQ